jgi:hypothetical protein
MQDAVIGMAILVVLLALWRLHSRPQFFGGFGPWAETNILGASTLSLVPRAGGPGTNEGQLSPAPPANPPAPPATSNVVLLTGTNRSNAAPARPAAPGGPAASNAPLSTNFLNTNGPVAVIGVDPADLVETPPGVASAPYVPEAAALARRLGEVSAKGGDIQISLSWRNYNDLDLHCVDPAGEEIFYAHRRSERTGGELDVDQNAHIPYNMSPVENIYWPPGGAPPGLYRIFVVHYAPHGGADPTDFLVRTLVQGRTNFFRSAISYTGQRERKLICNLLYDPANPNPAQRCRFVAARPLN